MSTLRTYLFACAICATAAAPVHAGAAPDVLVEAAEVCTSNGTSKDVVLAQLGSLGWEPILGDTLASWQLPLFASPFLANAAYKTDHSPTWEQAWKEGILKSKRTFIRSKKATRMSSFAFLEMSEQHAVLQLGTRSLTNREQLFCTIAIADDPVVARDTVRDPNKDRLRPINALTWFLSMDHKVLGTGIGMTGIDLNQKAISQHISGDVPADAYISAYVNVVVEI